MKIGNYDPTRPGMLMFEGDTGANPPAAGPAPAPTAIPAEQSPTNQPIPQAPSPKPAAATVVQPAPVVKQPGVLDIKKALNLPEAPSKTISKMAAELKKKATAGAIPAPPPTLRKKTEQPSESLAAPESETPAAPAPEPKKITLAGKEYTEEELAKHLEDLEKLRVSAAKPTDAAKPAEPKPPETAQAPAPTAELTPEQKAANTAKEKELDDKWIADSAAQYAPTEEELDTILSGGQKAVQLYAKHRAQDALALRKWFEDSLNPILKDLHASIDGPVQMHRQIQQYQEEASFFTQFEDLKPFQKQVRLVSEALHAKYPEQMAAMTPEKRREEIATHARQIITELGITPPAAAAPAPAPNGAVPQPPAPTPAPQPPAPPVPPAPKPAPATGNLGGARTPSLLNEQASMVSKVMEFENSGRKRS